MTLTYGELERFIAARFPGYGIGALRGRLKHFSKIKLLGVAPGIGNRIAYKLAHVAKIAVALELMELGLDPVKVRDMLADWPTLWADIEATAVGPLILRCDLAVHCVSRPWRLQVVDSLRVQPGARRVAFIDLRQIERDLDGFIAEQGG